MAQLKAATAVGPNSEIDAILISKINLLRRMDPNESVNVLAANGDGTLVLPFVDIVTRNDVLLPPFPNLLQLSVTEILLAIPHHIDTTTTDLHQLLVTVLKETVIQLARQLPEIIIRQAFAFNGAFGKRQFFNMIDEASTEHSTQPSIVKRINILAWLGVLLTNCTLNH